MEIQNLRLQLLHIADGNVQAAKLMEAYVLAEEAAEVNVGEEPKTAEGRGASEPKECSCPLCIIGRLIEEDPNKTLIGIFK